jgi:hypothetical protein
MFLVQLIAHLFYVGFKGANVIVLNPVPDAAGLGLEQESGV